MAMTMKKHQNQITPVLLCFIFLSLSHAHSHTVCIIGSGIGGASVAHFLRRYSPPDTIAKIAIFERHGVVGGRMATVTIAGETFEAGGSILHPKNYHASNYTKFLGLQANKPKLADDSLSLGIWDGRQFVYKTLTSNSKLPFVQRIVSIANSIIMALRYGVLSLFRMSSFVEVVSYPIFQIGNLSAYVLLDDGELILATTDDIGILDEIDFMQEIAEETVNEFLRYYEGFESRPVFESVEGMLKWAGLYNLTTTTLGEKLVEVGLSPILIQELATVITRINYGQSMNISGLAGAVSLAGSGGGLWSVKGGNWQMASGLINRSNVELHLDEEIESVFYLGDVYELNSTEGKCYHCQVTVVATPLDEVNILFNPAISIPPRKLQHTHATFVRGLLNPAYFGLDLVSDIPELVGTTESAGLPFTSISILKQHEKDMTYKVFSREAMTESLLDKIFSVRVETIKINWGAYPHYHAPEVYSPFILDGKHLYYVNAFENAASTMETSAVAAENIARLILSRLSGKASSKSPKLKSFSNDSSELHSEL